MKPVDVDSGPYIDFDVENNDKNSKLKVRDHVRIKKHFTKKTF